jgi:hypothetical protein
LPQVKYLVGEAVEDSETLAVSPAILSELVDEVGKQPGMGPSLHYQLADTAGRQCG